ncbi:MAG: hypothetical protein ABI904_10010 [Chloroflexota bacterium]
MKVKLNPMFEQVSGQLGDVVFRELRGKTIASRKATLSAAASANQVAHRERFKLAAAYGKSALADETVRAQYEELAKTKNMPVFAATIADFFNAPIISAVDLSAYTGNVGDVIKVNALDDFGVAGVHVTISNADTDALIENGAAFEAVAGSGLWVFTATAAAGEANNVKVNVVATDRPGGTVVSAKSKSL